MMTRTRTAYGSAVVWQSEYGWHWQRAGGSRQHAGPFSTLAHAIADAQRALGPDVAITRHSNPEPQS